MKGSYKNEILSIIMPVISRNAESVTIIQNIITSLEELIEFEILIVGSDSSVVDLLQLFKKDSRIQFVRCGEDVARTDQNLFIVGSQYAQGTLSAFVSDELPFVAETLLEMTDEVLRLDGDMIVATGKELGDMGPLFCLIRTHLVKKVHLLPEHNLLAQLLERSDLSKVYGALYPPEKSQEASNRFFAGSGSSIDTSSQLPSQESHNIVDYISMPAEKVVDHVVAKKSHDKREKAALIKLVSIIAGLLMSIVGASFVSLTLGSTSDDVFQFIVVTLALFLCTQGLFALFLMLYSWEDPDRIKQSKSPKQYADPELSFSVMVPAREEEAVIGQTLEGIAQMNYPADLTEIMVICSDDDTGTIAACEEAIRRIGATNMRCVVYSAPPINKPNGLNHALAASRNDVIVIFDAEDDPHKDILAIVNTVMLRDQADVVQSGVQLMNYRTNWFSMFNVMEYYFWFKSALHFFAKMGIIPLGGNTVFFKRGYLNKVGGWDNYCLTEDADIGIRLCNLGAKISVVYDEKHSTQEETPPTMASFVKQRTRWNHGFLQILLKGEWKKLPKAHQRFFAFYIVLWPFMHALLFLYVPISIWLAFTFKLPAFMAIVVNLPILVVFLHFAIFLVALFQFTRDYKLSYPFWLPLKALLFYFPYQILLGLGAFRAVGRLVKGDLTWEKTEHTNAHRSPVQAEPLQTSSKKLHENA